MTVHGNVTHTIPAVYVYPGLWDRVKAKGGIVWGQLRAINPREMWEGAASTAGFGVLVAIAAFVYLRRYRRIADHLPGKRPPDPGESEEDALAVSVLRKAGWASLVAVVVWIALVLKWTRDAPPLWLVLPVVALGALRITTWILHVCMPRMSNVWTRDMRSLWGAYQAAAVYALWGAIVLAAIPVLVYALREYRASTGFSGLVSLVVARLLTFRTGPDAKKRPRSAAAIRWLLALAIGVGLLLIVVTICTFLVPNNPAEWIWLPAKFGHQVDQDHPNTWIWIPQGAGFLVTSGLLLLLGFVGDANRLSPHYFYRDRLAEAYLYTDRRRPQRT